MDRATTWRQRIDLPTNWAITTGGAVTSFALSKPEHSHVVLLIDVLLTSAFLIIEARRMRYYDLWASWLRVLETDYLAQIISANQTGTHQPWEELLAHDFADPHFKVSTLQLVARRLRDTYLALYSFLLLCWLLKLFVHQPVDQGFSSQSLIDRAAIGLIPGSIVFWSVLGAFLALAMFTLLYARKQPAIEVLGHEETLRHMVATRQGQIGSYQLETALLQRFASEADDEPVARTYWD